ncbi:tyrosine-type recombinase/integrase [Psychrosphaera ytuae]|uniref:Tyrosine-type recombinase/integrase n=1 Tax=Psychrosphaera ytuae TaxID=2820710 RepID=A0A975HHR9_9GAMM|nr:site-specific integrase [Psychrosphaera ytuae]QTH63358.1 tyrosine-type recombinase/integrase [Psychrosphaera ytuae]
MNDKQIKAFIKSETKGRKAVADNLYIRVQTLGKAYWEVRYSINGKRKFMRIAGGAYPAMSLAIAKLQAALIIQQVREGIDPLAEKVRGKSQSIRVVNELFEDWFNGRSGKLKYPHIEKRYYENEVKPYIGELAIERVNARDIRDIIQTVAKSNRPSIANKTLRLLKKLFNHAIKLDLKGGNPAAAFELSDAGGTEKSRTRALSLDELKVTFEVFRQQSQIFTRDNYIAMALLLCLGVRKTELTAAKWEEFDLENKVWSLDENRNKTSSAIQIPLSDLAIKFLIELKVRAAGSDYLLPARRASKRRAYISDDTLNHALSKLFGEKVDSKKQPYPNYLIRAGIEKFTIHDIRRTFRSLLSELGTPSDIAERCLNHKITGVEGVYNRHDYFDDRKKALQKLSEVIEPFL